MVGFRNEDGHLGDVSVETKLVLHLMAFGDFADGPFEGRFIDRGQTVPDGRIEADTLKELARRGVRVLIGVENIQAERVEELG